MPNMDEHIQYFKKLLGDASVMDASQNLSAYEQGWRGEVGRALCVLRPTSTDDVSKIVSYCARNGVHIVPQSGNTGMVAGSVPDESGQQVVLSFDKMTAIYDVDTDNGCAYAGAGVRLSTLNEHLEKTGLCLPIDVGSDPCLGGMVATNTGGSRFLKYRGFRDHVMGMKVVLADEDGTVLNLLKPLHKDNTGLDVKQLFIGTAGVFGVVTEVMVRLSPRVEQDATALLVPASMDAVLPLFRRIERACSNYLSAFEGMSHNAMAAAFDHNSSLPSPFGNDGIPEYAILLELSRSWPARAGEQSLDDVLEAMLAEIWETDDTLLDNAYIGASDKLWALRHGLSEGVQKSGKLFAFDISFKRGDIITFRKEMTARLSQDHPELTVCDFGHLGDGGVHFALVIDRDDPRAKDATYEANIRRYINDAVVHEYDGSFSAEHGLGRKVQEAYDAYTPDEIRKITAAIKAGIAPAAIGTVEI